MVAQRSLRPANLLSCSTAMTGGKKTIQQRIALLVKHPETRAAAVFGACVALALVAVFTFSDGNQSGGPAGDYRRFLSDVQSAQSIRLGQPTTSSQFDPTAITDPELLAEAKEILKQECPDWLNPPQVVGDLALTSRARRSDICWPPPPTGGTPATSMCLLTVNSAGRRFPDAGWPP